MKKINIIGAGLAGVEAANVLLNLGYEVHMYEKRPTHSSPAHFTSYFAELVCSNSLKSKSIENACGLLKEEMRQMNSITMKVASTCEVPSGNALSVDREKFASTITSILLANKNFHLHIEDIKNLSDDLTILATGPLTSDELVKNIQTIIGSDSLSFFDASAPIIKKDSIDMNIAYYKSRYDQGDNSYINCPFSKEQYFKFYNELINAKLAPLHSFDTTYFEGCMPIEVLAKRGIDTIRFGPLKPKGLQDLSRDKAYAIVQLRQDNLIGDMFNIVGFQTNLTFQEQKRVFSMIPGLENAEFIRYGLMHRNTYLCAPKVLNDNLELKNKNNVLVCGQLSGVEGYVESAAFGILAGIFAHQKFMNKEYILPPISTMIGSLLNYITHSNHLTFTPMNANFSILYGSNKHNRLEQSNKAISDISEWWNKVNE